MRRTILLAISCGLLIATLGCGGGDSDSGAVASSSGASAPPAPPSAPSQEQSTSASIAPTAGEGTGSSDSSGYPGGASGPPGSSSGPPEGYGSGPPAGSSGGPPPGAYDGGGRGYPGGAPGPPGSSDGGNPGGTTGSPEGYPGSSGPPGGYPGSGDGSATPPPPRPKTLREKAVEAFRDGQTDEGGKLLAAHYLTNPSAGSELGRVMQFSPHLRKPALVTRIGVAVVFSSQPANFEGHPQPIGSTQLEAGIASLEQRANEARGGGGEGGGPRRSGRNFGRPGGQNAGGAEAAPALAGSDGGYGGGDGQNAMPTSPAEEIAYFTGELGEKLLEALRKRLEAGAFGNVYRDALKEAPLVANNNQDESGGYPGGSAPPGADQSGSGPPRGGRSSRPGAGAGPPAGQGAPGVGVGIAGSGDGQSGGEGDQTGGIVTGQLAPGIEFLGAAQNIKELGDLVKASSVDAVIFFEVRVRPAGAVAFVNNDTSFRVVSAGELNKPLFTSATLNNKKVHELRKKKTGEDPVDKEINAAMAALDDTTKGFKHIPLPALTSEQAMRRLKSVIAQKPQDATQLLLEARLFVAKKLLKPDEAVTLVLSGVTDDQLGGLNEVIEEGDVKEKIAAALSGKRADAPTTVLGKFGSALSGAGGLGGLVPTPQLPPIGLPPGGFTGGAAGGYPPSGAPAGAGGYGQPPAGGNDGSTPAPLGEAPRGLRGN